MGRVMHWSSGIDHERLMRGWLTVVVVGEPQIDGRLIRSGQQWTQGGSQGGKLKSKERQRDRETTRDRERANMVGYDTKVAVGLVVAVAAGSDRESSGQHDGAVTAKTVSVPTVNGER